MAHYPYGQVHDITRMQASSAAAMIIDYERDFLVNGLWYSEELHFFDMALSHRPSGARGCFEDSFTDFRPLGKIFLAPAGYRYRGEGGQGRQKSLSLFLDTSRLMFEDEWAGTDLRGVLQNCMKLESDAVSDILLRIGREVSQPGFASQLLLEGLSISLLVETMRVLKTLNEQEIRKGGLSPRRFRLIEGRVRAGGSLPSLAELAELCQLSRRQLVRAFRSETGQTIGAYVQQVTVERAKALLVGTSHPISIIAGDLGFASASAFSTAFRRSVGCSPGIFGFPGASRTINRGTEPNRLASRTCVLWRCHVSRA